MCTHSYHSKYTGPIFFREVGSEAEAVHKDFYLGFLHIRLPECWLDLTLYHLWKKCIICNSGNKRAVLYLTQDRKENQL